MYNETEEIMTLPIDPNLAYVFIVMTVLLTMAAFIVPGTGLPEFFLMVCLLGTAYEMFNLNTNPWALVIVALSLAPFIATFRYRKYRLPLLVLAILMLMLGSYLLFVDANGRPLVNLLLAASLAAVGGLFIWLVLDRGLKIQGAKPDNNPDAVVGTLGEARTPIHQSGTVMAGGELWSARSDEPIQRGSQVQVLQRDGFILTVRKNELPVEDRP